MPARVRFAMALTKWGAMTAFQARLPMSGQGGPSQACVIRTSVVPSSRGRNAHFTSMPRVMPST
jgi:hypothetical protein